jgi:phage gp29-like protein
MATPKPQKPPREELAKLRGNGTLVGQPFVELLHPDDSVLLTKGRDYKLYRETLRDDQCASCFSDRRLAVLSKEWAVDAASDSAMDKAAAEFLEEELNRLEWDRITDRMLYARWYGHAVAEALYYDDGPLVRLRDIRVRDRSRFAYSNDGGVYLLTERGTWERMPDRKFWTVSVGADHDDAPYGLGLAHYCYWPVFFKRNDLKFWLVFAEKFGSPTAVGKIPGGKWADEDLKDAVLDALLSFSSESAIVIPEEATMELLEAARSGSGTYDQLYDRMDSALAKVIVGQTASTEGTPGKLGGEDLRADVRLDLVKSDADLVCASFTRQVATWLTEWNFPGAGVPRVWRKVEPDEDLKTVADTDAAIKGLGFEPSEEYVQERYGKHWTKAEPLDLGGPGLGLPGTKPGAFGRQPTALQKAANDFADLGAIATLKAGKRADQDALQQAAAFLATRYQGAIGERVEQLLAYAEETQDYATFQTRLVELVEELPPQGAVETVRNANTFSRLYGLLRGTR